MGRADSALGEAMRLPLPLLAAGIPTELKGLAQWVIWSLPNMIPINPGTMRRAMTNRPETWGTLEQALAVWQDYQGSGVGGVGFVFTSNDPYCGADLDNCRDPETGDIEPWARAIIDRLNSYTELSPSGCGVHVIVRGVLPGSGRSARQGSGKVQLRGERFFFAVTGQRLEGTPTSIEDRQRELSEAYFETYNCASPKQRRWRSDPGAALRAIKELLTEAPNFSETVAYGALVGRVMLIQGCSRTTAQDAILVAAKRPYRLIEKSGKGWKARKLW